MGSERISEAQRGLLELLRSNSGKAITRDDILKATGWKPATLKAYLSKGHLSAFLKEQSDGAFQVKNGPTLDEWSFVREVTQSGSMREVGAPCESELARALVRKARDNMVLALELYNRPTLENRLDAFCMLFCTAWEQLLKSEIIESHGEETIFTESEPGRRAKTISLERAVEKQFAANDPVKANILTIAELRHGATHLLMPEAQGVLSRLFQAGVLNFAKRFPRVGGAALFAPSASGLMSIVSDPEAADVLALRQSYGEKTATGIAELIESIGESIEKTQDERYAIGVEYRLVLTKSDSKADIRLSTAPGAEAIAMVVEKAVPVDKKYPFSAEDVERELTNRLGSRVNSHDVQSMLFREQWKLQNNDFHHYITRFKVHQYSEDAVLFLLAKIRDDGEYLPSARDSYGAYLKKAAEAKRAGRRSGGTR